MFNPSLEGYSGHTREVGKKSWWKSLVANKKDCRKKKKTEITRCLFSVSLQYQQNGDHWMKGPVADF